MLTLQSLPASPEVYGLVKNHIQVLVMRIRPTFPASFCIPKGTILFSFDLVVDG